MTSQPLETHAMLVQRSTKNLSAAEQGRALELPAACSVDSAAERFLGYPDKLAFKGIELHEVTLVDAPPQ